MAKLIIQSSDKRPSQIILQGEQIIFEVPDACLDGLLAKLAESINPDLLKQLQSDKGNTKVSLSIEKSESKTKTIPKENGTNGKKPPAEEEDVDIDDEDLSDFDSI